MLGFFDIFSVGIEIKFTSVAGAYYNTLGYSWYRVKKFFEKNLVKLLVKCNFIAFFVNPFAIFLKSYPWRERCHVSDR